MHDDFIGKTGSYTAPVTTRDRVRSVVAHDSIHEWTCPCSMPECHAVVFAALARNLNSSTPAIAFGTNVTFRPKEPDGSLRLGVIVVDGVEDLQSLFQDEQIDRLDRAQWRIWLDAGLREWLFAIRSRAN